MNCKAYLRRSPGLLLALKACGDSYAELARRISKLEPDDPLTRQAVIQWDEIPVLRVKAVSKATDIPNWMLRPDLYDPPSDLAPMPLTPEPSCAGCTTAE